MKREIANGLYQIRSGNITKLPKKVSDYFLRRVPRLKNLIEKRSLHLKIEGALLKNSAKKAKFDNISIVYILNNIEDPNLLVKSIHSLKIQVQNPHVCVIDLQNNPEEIATIVRSYLPKATKYDFDSSMRLSEVLKAIPQFEGLKDFVLFCDEDSKFNSLANLLDKYTLSEDQLYCTDFIYFKRNLKEYFINNKSVNFFENLNLFRGYYPLMSKKTLEEIDLVHYLQQDFKVLPAVFSVREVNKDFHKNNVFYRYFERKYETVKVDSESEYYNYRFEFDKKISIIIPTRDNVELLSQCLKSIEKSTYQNYEVIIIDHKSNEETQKYLETTGHKILRYEAEFNFAKMNNFAAKEASGEILCFLNNDIEVITEDWLQALGSFADQEGVGSVGAKLLFGNGLIQHAGMKIAKDFLSVSHTSTYEKDNGFNRTLNLIREVDGNTGACLFVSKEKFNQVKGFDENLKVTWQDADLALKLKAIGLKNLFIPYVKLYHYESKTRKLYPSESEKKEALLFQGKWKSNAVL